MLRVHQDKRGAKNVRARAWVNKQQNVASERGPGAALTDLLWPRFSAQARLLILTHPRQEADMGPEQLLGEGVSFSSVV